MSGSNGNGKAPGANGNGKHPTAGTTKWDRYPDIRDSILAAVRNAATVTEAAQAAGIARQTIHEWIRDRDDISDAITQARKEGRTARLALIGAHAEKDWRAAAWLLAIENPGRYSIKQRVEHSTPAKPMGEGLENDDSREALDRLGEALDAKSEEPKPSRSRLPPE